VTTVASKICAMHRGLKGIAFIAQYRALQDFDCPRTVSADTLDTKSACG
jgi:hypothetical protein